MRLKAFFSLILLAGYSYSQTDHPPLSYRIEMGGTVGNGTYAPLWFTSNRNGLSSTNPHSGYLLAGITYNKQFKYGWNINAGLDLTGGIHHTQKMAIHQIYTDLSWRALTLSIGSKERDGFPLNKNPQLSSGMMVEGSNTQPIPQIRGEIKDYFNVPGTKGWIAFKGHLAYGSFADNHWQRDFVNPGQYFVEDVLYHSKSFMLRLGNKQSFPLEFEVGILMASQFGGDKYLKHLNGEIEKILDMPENLKAYWKALWPQAGGSDTPYGEQTNVEGNMLGSWNFALNYYLGKWKIRAYLEHYFEDHSQMFWEYGRWKDGQLGIEVTFPKNRWINTIVWEGLCTKDQTGPSLYNGFEGQFPEYQISGLDDYYNHYIYGAWQYKGLTMGNPLLPGPAYNENHRISFKSNRVRAHHLGINGNPTQEWTYRILISFARHWGTYYSPLDKQRKQFSSLYETTYTPNWTKGWSTSIALGIDRGNYLGNSTGCMLTIKKTGNIFFKGK